MRRWNMAVARLVALLALAALLAGCTAEPARPLLSAGQRDSLRSTILNGEWGRIASEYPEAIRPAVEVSRTVPDPQWPQTMVECLRSQGIMARAVGGGVSYLSSSGLTQLEYSVENYSCSARYPAESAVLRMLSPRLAEAAFRYRVDVVRPCLLFAGVPSPAPSRDPHRSTGDIGGWNPFQLVWSGRFSPARVRYLEQRCPPVPAWLDLGE